MSADAPSPNDPRTPGDQPSGDTTPHDPPAELPSTDTAEDDRQEAAERGRKLLEEWTREHRETLVRLAAGFAHTPSDAEDIVQNVLAAMAGRLHRLDRIRKPRAYLRRCVRLAAHTDGRTQRRQAEIRERNQPQIAVDLHGDGRDDWRMDKMMELLPKLPLAQHLAVGMRFVGFTDEETADILGVKPGTIRSNRSRAKDALKKMVEEDR